MHARKKLLSTAIVIVLTAGSGAALAAPPAGSPYYADPQQSHVEDATSKGIQQVNMITCLMHAMRPDALVNDGAYIALVDETKCSPQGAENSGGSASSSDASQASSYMTAVIDSTRASNADPMRARIWIAMNEEDAQGTIFVNSSVSAAPDTSTPYGIFRLDFCGRGDGQPECMMRGYLDGASSGLSYYEEEDNEHEQKTVALRLSSAGTSSGSGRMQLDEGSDQLAFTFAYDQDHFRRDDGNEDQCFSRDASDPQTGLSVWRYGLYDAVSGERVTRNSGFPIEYTNGGQTYHGYLSYWGLSLPPDAQQTLSNGAIVQKVDYSGGGAPTRTNYTLVRGGGKLLKHSKHTRTLAEIDKIRFNTWVGDVTGFYAGATPNSQYILYWDDAASTFKVTGRMDCSSGRCETQDLGSEQSVAYAFWSNQGGVRGWSEALGGELFIDLRAVAGTLTSTAVDVVYRKQEIVYPDQMPTTLYCLRDCPTAATIGAFFAEGSSTDSPFVAATFNRFGPASEAVVYGSNAGEAALEDAVGDPVTITDAAALQSRPQYQWGVRTGRLFTELAAAECPNQPGSYCESQIDALATYYSWETGSGQWNQFAAVKDANGNYVMFDAPLQLQYQVPNGAVYGEYSGKSIVLQYGGFGDLWGIPGHCVSRLTNALVSCETQDSRYVPAFVVPFDAAVGRVTEGDTMYLVKWLDREIRFARKAPSACASLALPSDVTLPTAAGLKNPSDASSDIYIGAKPTVTDAPRVIHGEVKY
jgi:hypothetical protein